ncbi:Exodeoxyribonuclease III [Rickettsiales endosymbiont of Paramecium tredecaurelia]|nr:exodeoxyribonuclease III [Candidatus Sarmatiella mevalonica]MBL3284934.1 Exodeoxyribonuclease III [Candidatus Sarmatiella mevalonica]
MTIKIATWNVNSIRLRLELISRFCNLYQPDILLFQETKVIDELFPAEQLAKIGYQYLAFSGQKSYNGVAIASRLPFDRHFVLNFVNEDKRHIAITIKDLEIHNFYVPSGGEIADVTLNPKFEHKLKYIDAVQRWFLDHKNERNKYFILGDLNIAPHENDVWCSKYMRNIVSHTPIERAALLDLQKSLNAIDLSHHFFPSEKHFTWWSYRGASMEKNRGLRIDHAWCSANLLNTIKHIEVAKEVRSWVRTSDHVPLIIELSFSLPFT